MLRGCVARYALSVLAASHAASTQWLEQSAHTPSRSTSRCFVRPRAAAVHTPQIHLLEYTQSSNSLVKSKVFNHAGEIWALAPCPRDADLLATCYNTGTAFKATVWRVPGLSKLADSGSGSSGSDDSEDVGEGGGAGAAGAGAGAGAGAAMVDPASLSMAEVATLPDAETPVVSCVPAPAPPPTWPKAHSCVVPVHRSLAYAGAVPLTASLGGA